MPVTPSIIPVQSPKTILSTIAHIACLMQACYTKYTMKATEKRSDCPINFALETFGDKWSLLIVRDIVFHGKRTYGEFLESREGIATNILADRLALLQREDILSRMPHPTDKRKEIFILTEKGLDLIPVLLQIEAWSARHDPKTDAPQELVSRIEKDVKKVSQKFRDAVQATQDKICILAKI